MPPTQDQEDLEHEPGTEQMAVGIEKLRVDIEKTRADIQADQKRLTYSTWGIVLQGMGLVAGALAAGAAYVKFIH